MINDNLIPYTINHDNLIIGSNVEFELSGSGLLLVQENAMIGFSPDEELDTQYALKVADDKDSKFGGHLTVQHALTVNGSSTLQNKNLYVCGNVGIGTSNPEAMLDVAGTIRADAFEGAVPSGLIVMWYGSIENIPEGWVLCNGDHGTPDLSGRFIVGLNQDSDRTYQLDDFLGGAEKIRLTIEQMPKHDHTQPGNSYISISSKRGALNDLNQNKFNFNDGIGIDLNHVGGDQPHENRPPYYALYYIMKR